MSDFKASSTLDLKRPDLAKPTDPTKLDKHGASGSTCLDSIDNKPSISTPLESNSTVSFAASTSKTGHAKGKAKAKAKGKAKTKAAVASSSSAGDKAPAEDSKSGTTILQGSRKSDPADLRKSVCIIEPEEDEAENKLNRSKSTKSSEEEKQYCIDSEVRVPKSLYQRLDRSAEIRKLSGGHTLIRNARGEDCLVDQSISATQQMPMLEDEEWACDSDSNTSSSSSGSSRSSGCSLLSGEDGTSDMIPTRQKTLSSEGSKLKEGDGLIFSPRTTANLVALTSGLGESTKEPCNRNNAKSGVARKRKSFAKRLLGRAADENEGDKGTPPKRKSFFDRVKRRLSGRKSHMTAELPSDKAAE